MYFDDLNAEPVLSVSLYTSGTVDPFGLDATICVPVAPLNAFVPLCSALPVICINTKLSTPAISLPLILILLDILIFKFELMELHHNYYT